MLDPDHEWNINFKPPVIAFVTSIALTLTIYFIALKTDIEGPGLLVIILGLAILQAILQFVFFFHLGIESKPRWNLMIFFFMVMVITIIIGGSMWIMHNINYDLKPLY